MKLYPVFVSVLGAGLLISSSCSSKKETAPEPQATKTEKKALPTGTTVAAETIALFQPPLKALGGQGLNETDKALTDLGRHLYYEERLSGNDKISCNTCHLLDNFGVDGVDFSKGVPGEKVPRKSPTVYNAF